MSSWLSQGWPGAVPDLDEPDAALEQPAGDQELPGLHARAVHARGSCCGSRLTSKASAASICMRKASSNDWMRASSCGVVLAASRRCSRLSCGEQVELLRAARPRRRGVLRMFSISFSMSVCWVSMYVPW